MTQPRERLTLQKTSDFSLELELGENSVATLFVQGVIDERANLSQGADSILALKPPLKHLRIHAGKLTRINSCGIREWIIAMGRISPQIPCSFTEMNELFIEQANMIPVMFGKNTPRIESFYAPFRCSVCDRNIQKLLTPAQIQFEGEKPHLPSFACEKCGKALDFDWLEEEYFLFLKHTT